MQNQIQQLIKKIRSRKLPFEIKIQQGCSRDSKNKTNIFIRARNKRRKRINLIRGKGEGRNGKNWRDRKINKVKRR